MEDGIDSYIGYWCDPDGYRLEITKVDSAHASVSLFTPFGPPVSRPYWGNRPTVDMPAEYYEYDGEFQVELWEPGRGFILDVHYDHDPWHVDEAQEELAVGLCRHVDDDFLDQYYRLFGRLERYRRDPSRTSGSS